MHFINLHTSILDTAEFKSSTQAQRGTWLSLYRYCAGQENGGTISHCRTWSDRVWLQICGVSLRDVVSDSALWGWDSDSLVLEFYNKDAETKVNRLRSQAVAGAQARWLKQANPTAMPSGMPQGIPSGNESGNGVGDAKRNVMERKEKEGKGMEGNPEPEASPTAPPDSPSLPLDLPSATPKSMRSLRKSAPAAPRGYSVKDLEEMDPGTARRLRELNRTMGRLPGTRWTAKEWIALKTTGLLTASDTDFAAEVDPVVAFYEATIPELRDFWRNTGDRADNDYRRRNLITLLNNWSAASDEALRWRDFKAAQDAVRESGRL